MSVGMLSSRNWEKRSASFQTRIIFLRLTLRSLCVSGMGAAVRGSAHEACEFVNPNRLLYSCEDFWCLGSLGPTDSLSHVNLSGA